MSSDIAKVDNAVWLSTRWRFQAAMLLAIVADGLEIALFPLFSEGAFSPADDVLDVVLGIIFSRAYWVALGVFAIVLHKINTRR